jgi:hypothetical protein
MLHTVTVWIRVSLRWRYMSKLVKSASRHMTLLMTLRGALYGLHRPSSFKKHSTMCLPSVIRSPLRVRLIKWSQASLLR